MVLIQYLMETSMVKRKTIRLMVLLDILSILELLVKEWSITLACGKMVGIMDTVKELHIKKSKKDYLKLENTLKQQLILNHIAQ